MDDTWSDELEPLVRRTEGVQPWRRAFHVAGGLTIAGAVHALGVESGAALAALGGVLVGALALDVIRLTVPRVNVLFFRSLRALASPREARSVASSTWYLAGAFLVLLAAPPATFVPVMMVLAFADPAASVVGRLWGRRPLGKGTWEGSAVFYLVAAAVLTPSIGFGVAAAVAAVVAAAEIAPLGLDDNLVIPVVAAACLATLGLPSPM